VNPIRTRGWGPLLALVVTVLLGPLGGWATAPARAQDPASECVADGGIYVHVLEQGAELMAGCSHAQTGMARLLEFTTVQTAGQGFVCQIDGRPDQCVGRPAGDEPYWSYWWWRDGEWQYANIGASYRGVPGSVEAWHYSVGEPPPFAPGDLPAANGNPDQASDPAARTADDASPGWLPTVITAVVLVAAGGGYLIWRRSRAGR